MFGVDSKIQIIRDFLPITNPHFNGDENACGYIIWKLYNRVCEAIKSFVALLDNSRYYDAFVIAGHALENCAMLSYMKDNDTEAKQLEKYNKYLAGAAVGRLLAILDMDKSNLANEHAWNAYVAVLKIFYPVEASIIKDNKNAIEKHEAIMKVINFRGGLNTEKSETIRNSYRRPILENYITSFSKNFGNIDDGEFSRYYMKYCDLKHGNMLSPGALAGDIDDETIDCFVDLILGIVVYLDKSKLNPIKTSVK
ncbi:MAG: hypothetical protein LBE11_02645 [Prevotellaceae bacterium]|jgi:hypothetical protein|nr:hypothetical protein [Prevotellaceae bacterium]